MYRKVKNELRHQALQKTPKASGALASAISEEPEEAQSPVRYQPQNFKRTVSAVLAVFIAMLAIFGMFRISANLPEVPSSETPHSAHGQIGLIVVSAAGTEAEDVFSVPTHPDAAMELPVKGLLAVEALADDTDRARIAAEHSIYGKMRDYLQYQTADSKTHRVSIRPMTNVLVGYGTLDTFVLNVPDSDALLSIRISLDGFGVMELMPADMSDFRPWEYLSDKKIVLTKEQYENTYLTDNTMQGTGLFTYWSVCTDLLNELNKDPGFSLSDIRSVVTFTVTYTDGETQSFQVEITFNDNGEMRAVYKNN